MTAAIIQGVSGKTFHILNDRGLGNSEEYLKKYHLDLSNSEEYFKKIIYMILILTKVRNIQIEINH